MSFCGDDAISPNECDATPPPDMETIPLAPSQADSFIDVSEPFQGTPHLSNNIFLPEEYVLIY